MPASTNHNSTDITLIDEALAAIDSLCPSEEVILARLANTNGVDPETLRRRTLIETQPTIRGDTCCLCR